MDVESDPPVAETRPRVVGEREQELLDATLTVLADVGYDRLTMDAVAAAARASKATLYRRWQSKWALVIDAFVSQKPPVEAPDTGSLRDDLLAVYCGMGGLTDPRQVAVLGAVLTAVSRDPDFAAAFRRDFVGPRIAASTVMFTRARERGEIDDAVDLDLLSAVLPGIVLHRTFVLGRAPDPAMVADVVDQVVLPAARRRPADPT